MNWRGRHIYLVGLPGAGKTSIGKEFAQLLSRFKYSFLDLDSAIEKQTGKTIDQIFDETGEEHFRDIETEVLAQVAESAFHEPKIIATGGGAVIRSINRTIMRGSGLVVHVDVSVREAAQNIINGLLQGELRPLLRVRNQDELIARLEALKSERNDYYEEALLHFVVRSKDYRSPRELAQELLKALQEISTRVRFNPSFTTTLGHSAFRTYPILVGNGIAPNELAMWLNREATDTAVVITDTNVDRLHVSKLIKKAKSSWSGSIHKIALEPGESSKSSQTLFEILDHLHTTNISRRSAIVAVGGGMVTDIAGLAAHLFKRGVKLLHIPTTLLAQADAAVGGKTGIDHRGAKNLLGTIYPPHQVVVDPMLLRTLDKRQLHAGLAEVFKYGLIGDRDFWNEVAPAVRRLVRGLDQTYVPLIRHAVTEKLRYVEQDEFEEQSGIRELLNFGHTFAHGLEAATNFEVFLHGEAVLLGMRAAAWLSSELGYLREDEWRQIEITLGRIPVEPPITVSAEAITEAMKLDKKRRSGHRLILLRSIGEAFVQDNVSDADVMRAIAFMQSVS